MLSTEPIALEHSEYQQDAQLRDEPSESSRRISGTEPVATEPALTTPAIATSSATSAVDPTVLRILERMQIQNATFQQAQLQTNEALAKALGRPVSVSHQTKPPILPPINNGPHDQHDIAHFEPHENLRYQQKPVGNRTESPT